MNTLIKTVLSALLLLNTYTLLSQDIFIYKNGDELAVKVLKVNQNDIIYKKLSNIHGPDYTEEKSNIFMIKYKNGEKDIFNTKPIINKKETLEEDNCKHQEDSIAFVNNKYLIVCKNCNKKIRYATSKEVTSNNINNSNGNNINIPCGDKPKAPPTFNDPQYKQSPAYKAYYKKLKIWKNCSGN